MLQGFCLQRRDFSVATTATEEKRNRRKTINLQEKKSSCGGRKYIKYNNMLSLLEIEVIAIVANLTKFESDKAEKGP